MWKGMKNHAQNRFSGNNLLGLHWRVVSSRMDKGRLQSARWIFSFESKLSKIYSFWTWRVFKWGVGLCTLVDGPGKKADRRLSYKGPEKTTAPHAVTLALHILFTCFFWYGKGKNMQKNSENIWHESNKTVSIKFQFRQPPGIAQGHGRWVSHLCPKFIDLAAAVAFSMISDMYPTLCGLNPISKAKALLERI